MFTSLWGIFLHDDAQKYRKKFPGPSRILAQWGKVLSRRAFLSGFSHITFSILLYANAKWQNVFWECYKITQFLARAGWWFQSIMFRSIWMKSLLGIFSLGDHSFKTSANFHDFWPLPPYHRHSSKMLMKGIFDPYGLGPSAHGDTPPPLRHADVLNEWSLCKDSSTM